MEQNAADLLQKQVENSQSYLQSQMLSAQDLSSLTDKINTTAQALIDSGDISIDTLSTAATKMRCPCSLPSARA